MTLLGLLVDIPLITLIVLYKAPIMLIKGWIRLFEDLIGRSGPFLEDVCVPFAGLLILMWPFVVLIAVMIGIFSSFGFGGYASVVAYQVGSHHLSTVPCYFIRSLFSGFLFTSLHWVSYFRRTLRRKGYCALFLVFPRLMNIPMIFYP